MLASRQESFVLAPNFRKRNSGNRAFTTFRSLLEWLSLISITDNPTEMCAPISFLNLSNPLERRDFVKSLMTTHILTHDNVKFVTDSFTSESKPSDILVVKSVAWEII